MSRDFNYLSEGVSFVQIRDKGILDRGTSNAKSQNYSLGYSKQWSSMSERERLEIARGKVPHIIKL